MNHDGLAINSNGSSGLTWFWTALRLCNTFAVIILSCVVIFLFIQLQYVLRLVHSEEAKIDTLLEQVQQEQQGKIEQLSEKVEQENSFTLYQMAGTFTLLTCLITMFHMTSHLRNFHQPIIQRKILAILWMSPIYGLTSFFSLLLPVLEGYLAIVKDFYEAYVIYTFLSYLIAVLGRGDRDAVVEILARRAEHLDTPTKFLSKYYHPPPETSNQAKAKAVILECQMLAMQFVFLRPLTSIASFLVQSIEEGLDNTKTRLDTSSSSDGVGRSLMYRFLTDIANNATSGDDYNNGVMDTLVDSEDSSDMGGAFSTTEGGNYTATTENVKSQTVSYFTSPFFFIAMITNISVFLAFTGLLKFYHAVQEDLKWCQPFSKFMAIKGVVFLTFWQGLVISIFVSIRHSSNANNNDDGGDGDYTEKDDRERALQIQNVLICLEMLFFSLAHWFVFPSEEYEEGYLPKEYAKPGIGLGDFVKDIRMIKKSAKEGRKVRKLKEMIPEGDYDLVDSHHGVIRGIMNDDHNHDDDDDNDGSYHDDTEDVDNNNLNHNTNPFHDHHSDEFLIDDEEGGNQEEISLDDNNDNESDHIDSLQIGLSPSSSRSDGRHLI